MNGLMQRLIVGASIVFIPVFIIAAIAIILAIVSVFKKHGVYKRKGWVAWSPDPAPPPRGWGVVQGDYRNPLVIKRNIRPMFEEETAIIRTTASSLRWERCPPCDIQRVHWPIQ